MTSASTSPRSELANPRVIIIGGGFAGLEAAKTLSNQAVHVTLIDKRNFHLFQPLLYQVATGTLSASDIIAPFRMTLSHAHNIDVRLQTVIDVDAQARQVLLSSGDTLPYEYLIVAAGSQTSYFNNDDLAAKLVGLKTLEDAESIRQRILMAFEEGEETSDPFRRQSLLTFVVVGGGATGVELAGAISELATQTLTDHYKRVRCEDVKIILVEGLHRILEPYPEKLSDAANRRLANLRVTLRTNSVLIRREGNHAVIKHGDQEETLLADTVIWTAGVEGVPLAQIIAERTGCGLTKRKTLVVQPDFSLPHFPEIFIVGDLCSYQLTDKTPLPGVAPAAMQTGNYVAHVILSQINQQPTPAAFQYNNKGSLAVIGKGSAVAQIGKMELSGFFAWLIWAGVHIMSLIGFGNRIRVAVNWIGSYLLSRNSSLIIQQYTTLNQPLPIEQTLSPQREHTQV